MWGRGGRGITCGHHPTALLPPPPLLLEAAFALTGGSGEVKGNDIDDDDVAEGGEW